MGNALRSIAMRIRSYSEETGEYDKQLENIKGDVLDLTKTAKKPLGVSLFTDASQKHYKSLVDYLGELSEIWDDLEEKNKQQLLQKLFAKTQAQAGSAIIQNFDQVRNAISMMQNSAGSADREMTKIEQGWDYKLNKLGETWTGVLQEMLDRKGFASILDMIQGISDAVSGLTDTFGGLSTAAAGLFGALAVKGSSPFLSYNMKQNQWSGAFPNIKESFANRAETKLFKGLTKEDITMLQNYNSAIETGTGKFQAYKQNMQGCSQSAKTLAIDLASGKRSLDSISSGFENVNKTSKLASFGMKAFSIAANMVIGMGIGLAIQGIVSVIDNLIHAEERTKEASESLASDLEKFNSSVNKNANEFSELAKTYHELSSGVDDLGRNIGLTDEQFKTYNDTVNKMVDMDQSIVKFWNDQGQAIIDVGENLDETNKKYQETLQLQARKKLEGDEENDIPSIQKIYDNINNYSDSSSDQNRDKMNQYKKLLDMTNSANENQKKLFKELLGYNKTVDTLSFGFFSDEDIKKQYQPLSQALDEIKDKYGSWLDDVISEDKIEKEWDQIVAYIKEQIDSLDTELSSREKQFQSGLQTQFESMDEYWQLDETGVNLVSQLIGSMDDEMRQQLELKSPEEGRVWLEGITQSLMENSDLVSDAYQQILTINESDLPVDKAYEAIMKYINQLASLLKQDPEQIKKMFGFNSFFGELVPAYDRAIALGSNGTYGSVQGAEGKGFTNSVGMKQAMAENSINTTEEINNFIEILQKANSLDEAIQRYNASLDSATEETKTFRELWKELDKETRNKLLDMAKGGNLSAEAFEKFKKGKYAQMFKDIGIGAEEAVDKINKMVQGVEQMSSMKTGISAILSAYDEKRDAKDNRVGADTLQSLGNTLGVSKWKDKKDQKVWDKYQKTAASGTASLKKLKAAQDALATSYVNNESFLADLDEEHKDYYKDLLTEMGVTNADAVVTESLKNKYIALNREKMATVAADRELTEAEKNSFDAKTKTIGQLIEEGKELGYTGTKLKLYVLETIKASKITLATDGSIKNLRKFAEALGAMPKQARQYATLVSNLNKLQSGLVSIPDSAARQHQIDSITSQIEKIESSWTEVDIDTSGGSTPNSPSGDDHTSKQDKEQKANKQYIDWIERRITRINNIISKISSSIENIGKWGQKIGKNGFDWADKFAKLKGDKYDDKRVKLTNKALEKEIKYYKDLAKMEQLASKKYNKKANEVVKSKQGKKVFKGKDGSLMLRRIKSGKYKKSDFQGSTWYQQLTDKQKEIVDSVIDFYDKGKSAKQAKQEVIANARNTKIQTYQNYQDLYDTRVSRAEARESIRIDDVAKNKSVETQIKNLKLSYEQQKEIAKLNGDKAEYERLEYEEKAKIRELYYHEIENIKDHYANLRSVNARRIQDAQNLIDVAEAEGRRVNVGWYQSQNLNERDNISKYEEERKKILTKLDTLVEGSEEWYSAMEDLQAAEDGLAESTKTIADNLGKIRDEIDATYDQIRENNNFVYEQAQFMSGLLREDSINTRDRSNGYYKFSNAGVSRMATANVGIGTANENIEKDIEQYNSLKRYKDAIQGMTVEQADAYLKEMAAKDKTWIYDSYKHLMDADKKYTKQYMDDVKARQEAENQMIDLMKEYYEGQKSYLGELIDTRKKLLDEEKDLYDYEKNINEKTKNIATLQKRLVALRGDTSEEGRARRRQIENQLDQAQQDLQDTEYERWKTDQEQMLTNLQDQFNDIIDQHLKYPDELLKEAKGFLETNQPRITAAAKETNRLLNDDIKPAFTTANEALTKADTSGVQTLLGSTNYWLEQILKKIPTQLEESTTIPDGETDGDGTTGGGDSTPPPSKSNYTPSVQSGGSGSRSTDENVRILTDALTLYGSKEGDKKNALNKALAKFSEKNMNETLIIPNNKKYKKFANYISEQLGTFSLLGKDGKVDWTEDSKLYKKLKSKGLKGFKTGGIGTLVKASGEDGLAMVRNGEGFVAPEHVQSIQQLLKVTPDMSQMITAINKNGSGETTNNFGGFTFELPNVTDARSLINEFQNSKDMQRLLQISVEDLTRQGHYSQRIHNV